MSEDKWSSVIDRTLIRAVADRWDGLGAPNVVVEVPIHGTKGDVLRVSVGYLLRRVALAMEERP